MSFMFTGLDRREEEGLLQFDDRISKLFPLVGGYAYFDLRNYNVESGNFGAYVSWIPSFNDRLNDKLPSGGYFVKATLKQAYDLHDAGQGLPVYVKLISRGGRLYPYRTYLMVNGRPFSFEFDGSMLIPFEDRDDLFNATAVGGSNRGIGGSQRNIITGSNRGLAGSQVNLLTGSNRGLTGSQVNLLTGSNRGLTGSQVSLFAGSNRSIMGSNGMSGSGQAILWAQYLAFMSGSNRGLGFLGGSQRFIFGGSNRGFSFLTGSNRRFEFLSGSNRGLYFMSGSNRGLYALSGSNRGLYFMSGSNRGLYMFGSGLGLTGSNREMFWQQYRRFMSGSNRGLMMLGGSQRFMLGGSNRGLSFLTGSNRGLEFLTGSNRGLYFLTGSNREIISLTGSNRGFIYESGSNRAFVHLSGSQTDVRKSWYTVKGSQTRTANDAGMTSEKLNMNNAEYWFTGKLDIFPKNWRLIEKAPNQEAGKGGNARLGYGLDLI